MRQIKIGNFNKTPTEIFCTKFLKLITNRTAPETTNGRTCQVGYSHVTSPNTLSHNGSPLIATESSKTEIPQQSPPPRPYLRGAIAKSKPQEPDEIVETNKIPRRLFKYRLSLSHEGNHHPPRPPPLSDPPFGFQYATIAPVEK